MINYFIPRQNYELILERIGAIIVLELENQVVNFYNSDADQITVYVENTSSFDEADAASISLCLAPGSWDNRHAGYVRGTYTFYVDTFANAKTTAELKGSLTSAVQANRIMGMIRAILEDPIYKTLGYDPGNIGNVKVTNYEIGDIKNIQMDAANSRVNRIVVEVQAAENDQLLTGVEMMEALTTIKLELTDNGYQYQFIAP